MVSLSQKAPKNKLIKSKLLSLMEGLDKELLINFKRQIQREGNAKRDLMLIFKYCLKHHPNYQTTNFYQEVAFTKIFKEPFDYVRLMRGFSNVSLRLEKFLIENELTHNDFLKKYLLAKAYNRYNLAHSFQQLTAKETTEPINGNTTKHYLERLQWNHLTYFSGVDTKTVEKNSTIKKSSKALDLYFVGIKLRHLCELATRQVVLGEDYRDEFETTILEFCKKNKTTQPTVHTLYWYAFQLIKERQEALFYVYRELYWESWHTLTKEDQVVLLTYLMNYLTSQTRRNKEKYIRILFQFYQSGIDKKILLINERFIEDHFVNLVYVSSYLKEFEWIYGILAEWKDKIITWLIPAVFNLSMARLTFEQALFNDSLDYLIKVDYHNFIYAFRAKELEIACAYELNMPVERVISQCKAYENYLRRHQDTHKAHALGGLNFIYIIRQLQKINPRKEKLLQAFHEFELISLPKWLLEKIEALK